ncbi:DUF3347 domain-containing protein [Pontibacter rugosus]|uniref:DUF3347 domain-containing protein n=1 Tax=Pontibacter rugosus TaxID=1745966 RepID=A0ABW3SNC5_9BACT
MKKYNLKWTSIIVAIMVFTFMTACGDGQQEAAEETDNMGMADGMEGMGEMEGMDMAQQDNGAAAVNMEGEPAFVVAYMDIKNALVNDNYEQVQQAANALQSGLEGSQLSEEQRSQLSESAGQLAEAQDIEAQRQAFAQLSRQLYEVVKNNNVTENKLYWQHCPMALNNQGANWLSFEEKVRNPFMGQRMPGCGSVEETI